MYSKIGFASSIRVLHRRRSSSSSCIRSPECLDDGVGSRANLYKTMKRSHKAGLISVRQTERDQLYPELTIYELTDEGRQEVLSWLVERLSSPRNEFPEFSSRHLICHAAWP
jgi:DNA-binding PadR family transcriptional regulator